MGTESEGGNIGQKEGVNAKLKKAMRESADAVYETAIKHKTTLRNGGVYSGDRADSDRLNCEN